MSAVAPKPDPQPDRHRLYWLWRDLL